MVRDANVDAALLMAPSNILRPDAGLKIIDIEPIADDLVHDHLVEPALCREAPHIVERFLKASLKAFTSQEQPEKSTEIIRHKYTKEGQLNAAQAAWNLPEPGPMLEPKLYPSIAAIAGCLRRSQAYDADAKTSTDGTVDLIISAELTIRALSMGFTAAARRKARKGPQRSGFPAANKAQAGRSHRGVKACGHRRAQDMRVS